MAKTRVLFIVFCLLSVLSATAQNGFINYDVANGFASAAPQYLTAHNGRLYFFANNGSSGREFMYIEDTNKAVLPQNLAAGNKNAIGNGYKRPIAGMGSKVYFTSTNGSAGEEVFMYDGTTVKLIADLTFGPDSSRPDYYTPLNGKLYFIATTAAGGTELYEYNEVNFPKMVTDINPGAANSVSGPVIAFDNKIFFVATTSAYGSELWFYDPVADTSGLAADIDTGVASSNPADFTVINGKLYLSASTVKNGREMYEYDGSNAPTMLTDISPSGLSSISPSYSNAFAWYNNKIYFAGRDTFGQTHVHSYNPANSDVKLEFKINTNGSSQPRDFVVYNKQLFFTANDGSKGFELYHYDSTGTMASLVGDLCDGANGSFPMELTPVGDNLFFAGNDCNLGIEVIAFNYKKVGIQDIALPQEISVYPNPVQDELHINFTLQQKQQVPVTLTDVYGRTVYSTTKEYSAGAQRIAIPMSGLATGVYIYNVGGSAGKVVKE
ncbi:MAG: T9SS type A sorting domain-containing protein [Chitinophagales bacterium]|nr:T9SS type A sorting domain-containing protein [Chitinophagaceae bacterium]MCB9066164.1 T9SS type A sorting domain-containing protein [Chitinophagales bacterium]